MGTIQLVLAFTFGGDLLYMGFGSAKKLVVHVGMGNSRYRTIAWADNVSCKPCSSPWYTGGAAALFQDLGILVGDPGPAETGGVEREIPIAIAVIGSCSES